MKTCTLSRQKICASIMSLETYVRSGCVVVILMPKSASEKSDPRNNAIHSCLPIETLASCDTFHASCQLRLSPIHHPQPLFSTPTISCLTTSSFSLALDPVLSVTCLPTQTYFLNCLALSFASNISSISSSVLFLISGR
jgi:hypothetical protein